jgi:hypothetical protein
MKALYQFYWDCKRSGDVTGLFVAHKTEVEAAIGRNVNFGEILGKHSEICGVLETDDLTIKSEDQEFIAKLVDVIGRNTISGYNPLEYLGEDEPDDEDEDEDGEDD